MYLFLYFMQLFKPYINQIILVTISSFFLIYSQKAAAQQFGINDTIRVHIFITSTGDTIPTSDLPPFFVEKKLNRQQSRYWQDWTRLRNAIYVTYPYAKASSKIMNEINAKLVNVSDKKMRKAIIRSREKELKKEFADKLTQLSIYQGRVLMKLIYRQTNNSCYEIIEEYKGVFTAAFWQTVAVIFGGNLKLKYEANGADREMEKIVQDVAKMYGDRI